MPRCQGGLDDGKGTGPPLLRKFQGAHDRAWEQLSVRDRRKLYEPHAVSEVTPQSLGQLQGEPRLANARGTHQGAEALLLDDPQELRQLAIPIDKWRQLGRQIVPALARSGA